MIGLYFIFFRGLVRGVVGWRWIVGENDERRNKFPKKEIANGTIKRLNFK